MVNRLCICSQTTQINIRYLIIIHQYFILEQISILYFIVEQNIDA